MPKQSNRARTLKTTAHPQEAGYELIFWAIEDILELKLNCNEAAALRRIIAMGSQAFYDSLGAQGLQLLARRRGGAHARVSAMMPTQSFAARSALEGASSFNAEAKRTPAPNLAEQLKVEEQVVGYMHETQQGRGKASGGNPFSDMKAMAISRDIVTR